jgi:acyl-coenzyme A thioesterase PaaI-like protein
MNKNTLMEQLGIEYLEVKDGYVKAKVPVDKRTKQAFGILHAGPASPWPKPLPAWDRLLWWI